MIKKQYPANKPELEKLWTFGSLFFSLNQKKKKQGAFGISSPLEGGTTWLRKNIPQTTGWIEKTVNFKVSVVAAI